MKLLTISEFADLWKQIKEAGEEVLEACQLNDAKRFYNAADTLQECRQRMVHHFAKQTINRGEVVAQLIEAGYHADRAYVLAAKNEHLLDNPDRMVEAIKRECPKTAVDYATKKGCLS